MIDAILGRFHFDPRVEDAARSLDLVQAPARRERGAAVRARVLRAFTDVGIAESDLRETYGYGYDDPARDAYEALLARLFGVERVFARLSLVSGTHAIVTAIAACVPPGRRLIVATGRPYDTLANALIDAPQSLVRQGIACDVVPLAADGSVDVEALARACERPAAAVFVQRSRGYAPRPSLSAEACGEVARVVKAVRPDVPLLVDNCYGELVEDTEPTHHGADLVIGSLLKNLGGGLAPGGAYVAGRSGLVERVATQHYAPGLGSGIGPTLGYGRTFVQGLLYAPLVIEECLTGLDLAAGLFERLGFAVDPRPGAPRFDIVQAIALGDERRLKAFARGLQRAMPLNARFMPEPGNVPGYAAQVIMSAGSFVPGATIELSCDAPLRAPYEVYLQGGLMREQTLVGAMFAADAVFAANV